MDSGNVMVSRRAALVVNYLRPEAARKFIEATAGRNNADQIRQPYRGWFLDVRNIPEDQRARYRDLVTGMEVVRQITANV